MGITNAYFFTNVLGWLPKLPKYKINGLINVKLVNLAILKQMLKQML
jgi:hypothetical protein